MDRKQLTKTVTNGDVTATFTFYLRERPRWVSPTTNNRWDRGHMTGTEQDYNKKPRLYVSTSGETLLDNLMNRTTRPVNVWGKAVRKALAALELSGTVGWYNKAGCAMCPCSPGFIWTGAPALDFGDGYPTTKYDAYVQLADAPLVREDAAAREEQLGRLESIAHDPTLPLEALAGTRL